jgi:hypothetical protein
VGVTLVAQGANVEELREGLRARYDVAALQNGVALIPRDRASTVRIIEVRDGAVSINGEELTARQLRDRLGNDADLVLRLTYLNPDDQRRLVQAALPPEPPPPPAPPAVTGVPDPPSLPRRIRRQEIVRVGGDVRVARDERVEDEVSVIFGNAFIDGEVDRNVNVVVGSLTLGPESVVHGDVNVVGGAINRAPTARIDGAVHNVGVGEVNIGAGGMRDVVRNAFLWRVGGLAATLLRVALLMLLALVVVAFGPGVVERIADRTAVDPVRAGLIGFLAELLFFPLVIITIIVLAVSIIGIPLLVLVPFGILLALIVLLVGFTGVAYQVGRALHARFGWSERGSYATVALGVVVIAAFTVLARSAALIGGGIFGFPLAALGYLIEYAAWTIGFGGAILAWLHGRRRGPVEVPALP